MSREGSLNILVVDDVPAVRHSICIALTAAGHLAVPAENGARALELIEQREFDILVTDIWMPEADGLSLIKKLRAERPRLRVFAMTGGGPSLTVETASSLAELWGAERVFLKPFDESDLLACLGEPPHSS